MYQKFRMDFIERYRDSIDTLKIVYGSSEGRNRYISIECESYNMSEASVVFARNSNSFLPIIHLIFLMHHLSSNSNFRYQISPNLYLVSQSQCQLILNPQILVQIFKNSNTTSARLIINPASDQFTHTSRMMN